MIIVADLIHKNETALSYSFILIESLQAPIHGVLFNLRMTFQGGMTSLLVGLEPPNS